MGTPKRGSGKWPERRSGGRPPNLWPEAHSESSGMDEARLHDATRPNDQGSGASRAEPNPKPKNWSFASAATHGAGGTMFVQIRPPGTSGYMLGPFVRFHATRCAPPQRLVWLRAGSRPRGPHQKCDGAGAQEALVSRGKQIATDSPQKSRCARGVQEASRMIWRPTSKELATADPRTAPRHADYTD